MKGRDKAKETEKGFTLALQNLSAITFLQKASAVSIGVAGSTSWFRGACV